MIASKISGITRTMEVEGHSTEHLAPIIHMSRATRINSDSVNNKSDGNSSDSSERKIHTKDKKIPVINVIHGEPPSETPPS